jgi:hypothetical protein
MLKVLLSNTQIHPSVREFSVKLLGRRSLQEASRSPRRRKKIKRTYGLNWENQINETFKAFIPASFLNANNAAGSKSGKGEKKKIEGIKELLPKGCTILLPKTINHQDITATARMLNNAGIIVRNKLGYKWHCNVHGFTLTGAQVMTGHKCQGRTMENLLVGL